MFGFISKMYGRLVKRRNEKFDSNETELTRCNIPVISVGNLSAGGSGKTPFVMMLAKYLLKNGKKPAIVGKGYKRKSKGEVVVRDRKKILSDVENAGDELILLAKNLQIPIIAHDKKYLGAKSAEENFNVDVIIIDDGFQHRQLFRDIDIVIVDRKSIEKPELLPKGRLREPISALKRADIICLAGGLESNEEIKEYTEGKLVVKIEGRPGKATFLKTGKKISGRLYYRIKKGSLAVSGIANPERFSAMLESQGFNLADHITFPDHHYYTKSDIDKIIDKCKEKRVSNLLITEKDEVKLSQFSDYLYDKGIDCYVFPFYLTITDGFKQFSKLMRNVLKNKR